MKHKRLNKGITLIALVITIIVLMILAAVSINLIFGQNGVIKKAQQGEKEYTLSEVKEKIEMEITAIQTKELTQQEGLTLPILAEKLENKIEGFGVENDQGEIEAIYQKYIVTIDENYKVQVTLDNVIRPTATYTLSTEEQGVESLEITINAITEDEQGIQKIVLPDGTEVIGTTAKYLSIKNGSYKFKLYGNNGATKTYVVNITNMLEKIEGESISAIIENNDLPNGTNIFMITGKTSDGTIETKEYRAEVINFNEDVTYSVSGGTTYALGDQTSEKKMLILKYNKNLTIDSGVTLTANVTTDKINGVTGLCCKKGMYIYCAGTLTNNGTISMTSRGTVNEEGENVYLWKNSDESFEYVPAIGGTGGAGVYEPNNGNYTGVHLNGTQGTAGIARSTGGGGAGASSRAYRSGTGGTGTSYSGGCGGGESSDANGGVGSSIGGPGGTGDTHSRGGAGNPGGKGSTAGTNGTGGLLIIYSNNFNNQGNITSLGTTGGRGGSSGGGSINIFYKETISNTGNISATGGNGATAITNNGTGGKGGNGCVTTTQI